MTAITEHIHITDIDTVKEGSTIDFDRIISVCQENVADTITNTCEYTQINLADGKTDRYEGGTCSYELFAEAAGTLEQAIENDEMTLIHCHAGISRSPSVTAAALASQNNTSFEKALNTIRSERPIVNPAETLREYARRYINNNN